MAQEIRRNCTLVAHSPVGGTLDLISPDGEVVDRFHVPQGRHSGNQWLNLVEPGYKLEVAEGVSCFQPRVGFVRVEHPDLLKSDANPDFQPTSASRMEREMRATIAEGKALNAKLAARQKALEAVPRTEEVPDAKPAAKPKAKAKQEAENEDGAEQ